jgi:hypothetical protein
MSSGYPSAYNEPSSEFPVPDANLKPIVVQPPTVDGPATNVSGATIVQERPSSTPTPFHSESVTDSGDRRAKPNDRRAAELRRKGEGRRQPDRKARTVARQISWASTVLAAVGTIIAMYAYRHSPHFRFASPLCDEGFGGQLVDHTQLSNWWAPAVVISLLGVLIPDKRKRPIVLLLLCGASIGLFVAAMFNVPSEHFIGNCLV